MDYLSIHGLHQIAVRRVHNDDAVVARWKIVKKRINDSGKSFLDVVFVVAICSECVCVAAMKVNQQK